MKVDIKFKKANLEKLLKNMVVFVDTREDRDKDIIRYLQKRNVPVIFKKLEFGDYSCGVMKSDELGLPFDISLENRIAVEAKKDLEELSANLTTARERFENEFIRAKEKGCDMHLVIENGSWKDISEHNYRTRYNEKSYYNSLLSFSKKYNIKIHFVDKEISGLHILRILQTELKKFLE